MCLYTVTHLVFFIKILFKKIKFTTSKEFVLSISKVTPWYVTPVVPLPFRFVNKNFL